MREIKFRVWCTNMKAMIDVATLHISETNPWVKDGREGFAKNFELMQYTGLKDKNGKDIYEGDIVRGLSTGGHVCMWVKPVVFKYGAFMVEGDSILRPVFEWDANQLEIIGNIYENEELIQG